MGWVRNPGPLFTDKVAGGVPKVGTITGTKFLRDDGTWAIPAAYRKGVYTYTTDAAVAVRADTTVEDIYVTAANTATRNIQLNTTGATDGDKFFVTIANGVSGFNWTVRNASAGGTILATLNTGKWARFIYSSTAGAWLLQASGTVNTTP